MKVVQPKNVRLQYVDATGAILRESTVTEAYARRQLREHGPATVVPALIATIQRDGKQQLLGSCGHPVAIRAWQQQQEVQP